MSGEDEKAAFESQLHGIKSDLYRLENAIKADQTTIASVVEGIPGGDSLPRALDEAAAHISEAWSCVEEAVAFIGRIECEDDER
jgi:hypothetical protein